MTERHLDQSGAIRAFLARFPGLIGLPFVTDAEMNALYGEEVAAVLDDCERFNRQERLCQSCRDRCCRLVRCEFYNAQFSQCPARPYRPPICRLHFCASFTRRGGFPVKELGDLFLDAWQAAVHLDRRRAALLDCPPFGRLIPDLIGRVSRQLAVAVPDRASEIVITQRIQDAIQSYRTVSLLPETSHQ
jgi:hypothetical protein